MKLSVLDRIAVLSTVPKEGSFLAVMTAQDIEAKVGFSPEEREKVKFQQSETGLTWDEAAASDAEIEFTDAEAAMISDALRKLDEKQKLLKDHIGIYRKFILRDADKQPKS